MSAAKTYDVAVIGAGVFGAWTAWHLTHRGQRVLLLDAYGPAHTRASSGGESRIIRMGYGADELYTRWSQRSLVQWKELFAATQQPLFHETGVLWLAGKGEREKQTLETLQRCGVSHRVVQQAELAQRYPQINCEGVEFAIFEPGSGVLMARRAVAAVVADAVGRGAEYRLAQVAAPGESGHPREIRTSANEIISAEKFVFACGAWLGKLFPQILGARIFPTRQEVFFFATPPGDSRFAPPALPTWLFQDDQVYGMPDLESRGLKIAFDRHGEGVDPDTQSRLATPQAAEQARRYVAHRFPALREAAITESRVCQYENTSSGDFLVDRHPTLENVWFVGGGSGHGFKHGPAMGEYVAGQVLGNGDAEPRFSLASKETVQRRAVY
ncbi:MAG TPA: N-methyl-L-tryptophan oxidase [Candidatus Acidoferrum sp.]|nr:N-methyl-L-tryptophan oxidase [Candidatus Acidoferrum sp.]